MIILKLQHVLLDKWSWCFVVGSTQRQENKT